MNMHTNKWWSISKIAPFSKYLVAGALAATLAGCGGSSDMGAVRVSMTDAPACGYDHVYVTVTQVSINSSVDGNGSWYDINLATPKKIDLLSLTNGALESLGQTALPAGTYKQLRLKLVPNVNGAPSLNNSVVLTGQTAEIALTTPSAVQTGIKLNTRAPFTVEPNTLVDLVLDFNACKSIVTNGKSNNGHGANGYLLKPVVTASPMIVSGAIDGYVDAADASTATVPGAQVFAEQNGVIVRGTVADDTGHFILSPLEQSSAVGNYDVVIVNGGKATVIINGTPVTAQTTTTLSTSGVPFVLAVSTTGIVSGTVNPAASATLDAAQTINGLNYSVATANADGTTGDYSFTLPAGAPQIAPYSSTLPIVPAPVAAAAGQYLITATSAAGNTASSPAVVTAGNTTTVNFPSLQ